MFEFPKDEQIFDSLKSVAERILSHEDDYDGKGLFFDKQGKFLGSFPDVRSLLLDLLENNKIKEDSEDIDAVLEQIAGETFLFENVELVARQMVIKSEYVLQNSLSTSQRQYVHFSLWKVVGTRLTKRQKRDFREVHDGRESTGR